MSSVWTSQSKMAFYLVCWLLQSRKAETMIKRRKEGKKHTCSIAWWLLLCSPSLSPSFSLLYSEWLLWFAHGVWATGHVSPKSAETRDYLLWNTLSLPSFRLGGNAHDDCIRSKQSKRGELSQEWNVQLEREKAASTFCFHFPNNFPVTARKFPRSKKKGKLTEQSRRRHMQRQQQTELKTK